MITSIIGPGKVLLTLGTITMPYITQLNGIILCPLYMVFGLLLSYYPGMLFVKCAVKLKTSRFEMMAKILYGPKMFKLTAICVAMCNLGFVVSYIVFIKVLIPWLLILTFYGELPNELDPLPKLINDGFWTGQIFWAGVYCFLVLLPLSIPRQVSSLIYTSFAGFACTIYVVVIITVLFFFDTQMVWSEKVQFHKVRLFTLSIGSVIKTFPFVMYAYMF